MVCILEFNNLVGKFNISLFRNDEILNKLINIYYCLLYCTQSYNSKITLDLNSIKLQYIFC